MYVRHDHSQDQIHVRQTAKRLIGGSLDLLVHFAALPFSRALPVDIFETADAYRIDVSLPGVDPDDVVVTATESALTIQAPAQASRAARGGSYVRQERHVGQRTRRLTFPQALDVSRITCTYRQGVLTVHVPRMMGKRIPVQVPAPPPIAVPNGQPTPLANEPLAP